MKEKYGDDRRTKIEGAATDLNIEDLIAQEDMVVTVSHEGYIKRLPATTYRSQGRGGRGIKGTESQGGRFRRAPVRRQHPRPPAVLHQPRPGLLAAGVRGAAGLADRHGPEHRPASGVPGRREGRQRAGGEGFRQGRALPDVRHPQGRGEEDRPLGLLQHPQQRHHRHRPGGRRRADRRGNHQRQGPDPARQQAGHGLPVRGDRRPRHGPAGGRRPRHEAQGGRRGRQP